MTNITNSNQWTEVPQIEPDEFITGGEDGTANKQAKALVARDNYLKEKVEENAQAITNLRGSIPSLDDLTGRVTTVENKNTQQDTALNGKFDKAGGDITGNTAVKANIHAVASGTGGASKQRIYRSAHNTNNKEWVDIEAGDGSTTTGIFAFRTYRGTDLYNQGTTTSYVRIPFKGGSGSQPANLITDKCPSFIGKFDKTGGTITGATTFGQGVTLNNGIRINNGKFEINRSGSNSRIYMQGGNNKYTKIEACDNDSQNYIGKFTYGDKDSNTNTCIHIPKNVTGSDCFMLTTKSPEFTALKNKESLPLGSIVAFPKAVRNPAGFLLCDGSTFNQSTYPDLYRAMGNKNTLPKLNRSDIGQTAFFPIDQIPDGWIIYDNISTSTVTSNTYPELYRVLTAKYGSINQVPKVEDRYLRNAHGSLTVGQVQEDEIKSHTHVLNSTNPISRLTTVNFDFLGDSNNAWSTLHEDYPESDNAWVKAKRNGTHSKFWEGGSETRPKTLVLKLCIKAKNTFDDVNFWIKSANGVVNQALLDASTLAQDIQTQRTALSNKADRTEVNASNILLGNRIEFLERTTALRQAILWQGAIQTGTINLNTQLKAGDVIGIEFYETAPPRSFSDDFSKYTLQTFTIIDGDTDFQMNEGWCWSYDWWYRFILNRRTGELRMTNNNYYNLRRVYLLRRDAPQIDPVSLT